MLSFKNCLVLCQLAGLDDCFNNYYLPNWDIRLGILTFVPSGKLMVFMCSNM